MRPLERLVWRRARNCCEYCLMPQKYDDAAFEIDHIIARKHHGLTSRRNLALTCFYCNSFKGPNVAGIDRKSHRVTPLFNPRRQKWSRHFRWQGSYLIGRTAVGRVTVAVLRINDPIRVELRRLLTDEGVFPPR